MAKKIESPCVSVCQLKGGLCTGCGRTVEEIRQWKMKRPEKMKTVKRADERLKKIPRD
ncbi:hypothetical protein L861_23265 [Litchfieldella anticariensis FP35 = DSM 16096]|uniref:Fe-S oxidoreductase n=1 Tax=Litchfieldella anticariensis (strain DSM 16096 / CECT 5854 / CIP 108499 / LMG 22089 / FP35) TaxID=1121939 RepID=S2KM66_LITA3|nr:DUF1289 domain-containing protein [Halomonas anticariensis]EPC03232.1 hypothetical protein L861_23265 [Halomonas anticariensis FP35 = DSM 16096]